MRVLITRPRAEAERLADELRGRGIDSLIAPMLEVRGIDAVLPDLTAFQALFVTSARGLHAFAAATEARDLAVYAVGGASARAAIGLGFADVVNADGDVAALVERVEAVLDPADGPLLHPTGAHVAGDPSAALETAGFKLESVVLYEAVAVAALADAAVEAMRDGALDAALFFSPRTAETFVRLTRDAGLAANCATIEALCQSPAVALAAADLPWRRIRTAARPDKASLLGLLGEETARRATAPPEAPPAEDDATPAGRPSHVPRSAPRRRQDAPAGDTETAPAATPTPPTPPQAPRPANQGRRRTGRGMFVVALLALAFAAGVALWPIILPRVAPDWAPRVGERDVAALEGRVHALETRRSQADLSAVHARLEALEGVIAELEARPAGERFDALTARLEALARRLDSADGERLDDDAGRARLAARLKALEAAPSPPRALASATADGGAAAARIDAVETALADLREASAARPNFDGDIAALESALADLDAIVAGARADASAQRQARTAFEDRLAAVEVVAAREARAAAHLLALGQLREALSAAGPYDDAWATVAATAPEDAPPEAMATLATHAGAGVETPARLAARFANSAMAIAAAGRGAEDGWVDEAVVRLRGLVKIRRVGDVVGAGRGAVAARAERLIAGGDVAAAIAELDRLAGPAAEVAAPWLVDARTRVAVDQALARLIAAALQASEPAS